MAPTEEQIASVRALLPSDATENGWDDAKILVRWAGGTYRTVREYWVDRVNETSGYIDLTNEGLPANTLWTNAKAMLEYWDRLIAESLSASGELFWRGSKTRKIKRV